MYPKLKGVSDEDFESEILVESKSYLTVRIGKKREAIHVYWQLVDPTFSLLQLGFEWPSGRFVHCGISLFNGNVQFIPEGRTHPDTVGTPCFDVSEWPVVTKQGKETSGNVLEHPGRIQLERSANSLSVVIKESAVERSILYAEKVLCSFDANKELSRITLLGKYSV